MKKRISLLLVFAMLLSLVACAKTPATTNPTETKPGTSETKPQATDPTVAPTEPVVIPTEPLPTADPNSQEITDVAGLLAALHESETGGSFKLGTDITIPDTKETIDIIKIMKDTTLDLNGKVLTINVTDNNNIFSVQGKEVTTFTIIDSVGGGGIKAIATTADAKGTMFRVNKISDATQHMVIKGGTYEYVAAEGIKTAPYMFNTTKGGPTVTIEAGTFNVEIGTLFNPSNSVFPQATAGKFSAKESKILPEGYTFQEITENGKTWYAVVKSQGDATEPTEPTPTTPTTPTTPAAPAETVEVRTAAELKAALEAGKSVKLMADITTDNLKDVNTIRIEDKAGIVLDLNGKTITIDIVSGGSHWLNLIKADMTINDSSAAKTGTVKALFSGNKFSVFRINYTNEGEISAKLTVNGGNFSYEMKPGYTGEKNNDKYIFHSNGILVINDGVFSATTSGKMRVAYCYVQKDSKNESGTLYLNGGKFTAIYMSKAENMIVKEGYSYVGPDAEGWYSVVSNSGTTPTQPTQPTQPTTPSQPSTQAGAISNAAELIAALHDNVNGGSFYLTNDIVIEKTEDATDASGKLISVDTIKVIRNTTLDLKGKTITIKVTDANNVFSLQKGTDGEIIASVLTINDSVGGGAINAVAMNAEAGGTLFRVNVQSGEAYGINITSGTFTYKNASGITTSKTPYLFNIANGAQGEVTISGGTFINELGAGEKAMYNKGSGSNGAYPVITGGSFNMDVSDCIQAEY